MHELDKIIILDPDSPIRKADPKTRQISIVNGNEDYMFKCAKSLGAIDSAINKSQIAIDLLKLSLKNIPNKSEFSTAEYIEYALENYIIRSRAVYDRVLIFIGHLCNLGIANDSITHQLLVTNHHVLKYDLSKKLKNINRSCDVYRNKRNVIIHHDKLVDDDFGYVSLLISVNHLSELDGKEKPINQGQVNLYSKNIIKLKANEYDKNLSDIKKNINLLFDECGPIYKYHKLILSSDSPT